MSNRLTYVHADSDLKTLPRDLQINTVDSITFEFDGQDAINVNLEDFH
jgi:plasmid maintenance system killer protein